mmetsp:Transcript_8650/g.14919  ORF Transcript_8650/g.14919 Transcript_8650/m.14919 type:complete len:158 (-) Transcript_8650:33-506(-)
MKIAIEINGVETKYTFLSSVAMAAFCLLMSVGSIVVLVFSNGSCILEFLLHLFLLISATVGCFVDQEHLHWMVKTHAHRASFCCISILLLFAQGIRSRNYSWLSYVLPFAIIGFLFFIGNVVASIVSCILINKEEKLIANQDRRTKSKQQPIIIDKN